MPRGYRKYDLSDYDVTKEGKIFNKHNGHEVKAQPNGKGYLRFWVGGKLEFVHRVVAEKYIPNPENKPQINHKDGNKLNNEVDNLEWVTNLENRKHAIEKGLHLCGDRCPWSKLTQEDVDFIRENPDISPKKLAEKFSVTDSTIRDVRKYKSWKNS